MQNLRLFPLSAWLQLKPLTHAIKQWRNDIQLRLYLHKATPEESNFIQQARQEKNVLCVIAFEQPQALHWLLSGAKRHLDGFTVLVFDNSNSAAGRSKIREVCAQHSALYLGLPENKTRHVNRSHGLAMTWVFEHIIRKLTPDIFGFIDHDLIPIAPTNPAGQLAQQPCYGLINAGNACWNLWAGFCFFRYASIRSLKLNFLYDFSRGLDTGGRNWAPLYSQLDAKQLTFARESFDEIQVQGSGSENESGQQRTSQVIDGAWLHIGGIGYNNNFSEKRAFFEAYFGDNV